MKRGKILQTKGEVIIEREDTNAEGLEFGAIHYLKTTNDSIRITVRPRLNVSEAFISYCYSLQLIQSINVKLFTALKTIMTNCDSF